MNSYGMFLIASLSLSGFFWILGHWMGEKSGRASMARHIQVLEEELAQVRSRPRPRGGMKMKTVQFRR